MIKSKKRNILILSTPDVNNAAGVIAYDLHKALSKDNNCEILTRFSSVNAKGVISYQTPISNFVQRVINKLKRLFFSKKIIETNKDYYFFDIDHNKTLLSLKKVKRKVTKPDYIIAYFAGGFFTMKDLYELQKLYHVPILLIMADMAHITGGCHYAWDCDGYKKDCSNCPAIIEEEHKHFAVDNLKLNKKLIDEMDIGLVALSSQDYKLAKQSFLFKEKEISFILGGINLAVFNNNFKQSVLKKKYSVRANDFVILFGAVKIGEKRKGVKYFVEAINYLESKIGKSNITIVSIGNGTLEDVLPATNFNIVNLGFISDYNQLAEVYNLADVFITTTIQDSGPMMVNQSIACGTPVVCFDIGVAKDIVINKKTGYKSELYNSETIAVNLVKLCMLQDNQRNVLRDNCVALARKKISNDVSAKNFLKIINEIKS